MPGYRCIAPDYAGFGRSDKPTDLSWYTYDRHVELIAELLEGLDVRDATAVVHDWGGPIGLRVAVEHPEMFSRLVIMEPGPFTGREAAARPGSPSATSSAAPRTCRSASWSAAAARRTPATR